MKNAPPSFLRDSCPRPFVLGAFALAISGASASAQQHAPFFSVDYHGPTKSRPDSANMVPISEGDVLRPAQNAGPFQVTVAPMTVLTGGGIGLTLYPTCTGTVTGMSCGVEVNAISYGNEDRYRLPMPGVLQPRLYFSVDRFAQGAPVSLGFPGVRSESQAREAASDIFTHVLDLSPPVAPAAVPPSNRVVFDGNGAISATGGLAPGLGLFEPHQPTPSPAADTGDDLDALLASAPPTGPNASIYFSLDGGFPDPNGIPHTDSAQLNGFAPAAVLRKQLGTGSPTQYASPSQLGLSAFLDDVDALALADNGDGIFQPSLTPFDWFPGAAGGSRDMLLFSVRRGSAVIGQIDSLLGIAIEPGDVLTTPLAGGNGRPGIFIAAEALGLSTMRAGGVPDELDAIAIEFEPFFDCNMNGVEDSVDIGQGASNDSNNNGIPDECEQHYPRYCTCTAAFAPCGNDSALTGCKNSTGVGGSLDGAGTTSLTTDDLTMDAAGLPPNTSTLLFAGPNQTQAAFGDGLRCIAGPTYRLGVHTATALGTTTYGPGLAGNLCSSFSQCLVAGGTFNFQIWYRNAAPFCTPSTFNLTNGVSVTYTP